MYLKEVEAKVVTKGVLDAAKIILNELRNDPMDS